MKLIIKSRKPLKIEPALEEYARKKFLKLRRFLEEEPATLEVEFTDALGTKGGLDKVVEITAIIPYQKQPFHLRECRTDFREAVNIAKERAEKHFQRIKDKRDEEHWTH